MNVLKLAWTFLGKGGWILPAALVLLGWYHANLKHAEEVGAIKAQVAVLKQASDSLNADLTAYTASVVGANQRADSMDSVMRHWSHQTVVVDSARVRSTGVADSVLRRLQDSLPQLAGQVAVFRAALDTANQVATLAKRAAVAAATEAADLRGKLAVANDLIRRAADIGEKREQQMAHLEQQLGSGHGFSTLDAVLAAVAVVATAVVVAHH